MSGPDACHPQRSQGGGLDGVAYVGIDLGAVSVKGACLRGDSVHSQVIHHRGRPTEALDQLLAQPAFAGERFVGVCGHLGHLTEAAALQRALDELGEDFDAVVSLGGESFLVYVVAGRQVQAVLSHNKCAAGSGEFLLQQIGRMGLELGEAIGRAGRGRVVPLASRGSVHCKSDITHKLNRHEASIDDILHTLHDSMADKVVALLAQAGRQPRRVLLIGGVSGNQAMEAALAGKLPAVGFAVLPQSPFLEAWGAALLTPHRCCSRRPARRSSTPTCASPCRKGAPRGGSRAHPDGRRAPVAGPARDHGHRRTAARPAGLEHRRGRCRGHRTGAAEAVRAGGALAQRGDRAGGEAAGGGGGCAVWAVPDPAGEDCGELRGGLPEEWR